MRRTYEETVNFLFTRLPVFQRDGASAYKPGLDNIRSFCEAIGNPQNAFQSIHVGGTNGKGSTSHSIASILQEEGYKTGLYTSPHLIDFRERIQINGIMIPKEFVVTTVENWLPLIDSIEPSFFELTVALCFSFFAKQKVEFAVIEVGMGGELDSTNIITPLVSLITNIGLDHQKFLGNTIPEIAGQKAGIIKNRVPIIISERHPETQEVFEKKSTEQSAAISFGSDRYSIKDLGVQNGTRNVLAIESDSTNEQPYSLALLGDYQLKNLKGILATIHHLRNSGVIISESSLKAGLSNVILNTGLKGRWQILREKPFIVCDTGHNEDGIREVMNQIKTNSYKQLWLIWGMVNDKDHGKIISLLPKNAHIIATQPHLERALPSNELFRMFEAQNFKVVEKKSVDEAIEYVLKVCGIQDFIFIGGSTFTVAEIPFQKFEFID